MQQKTQEHVFLFTNHQYFIFFVVVFVLYWAMPWKRLRIYLLLAASYFFYAAFNQWLAVIVVGTATLDWILALGIERAKQRSLNLGRLLMLTSIGVNLGVLCYFKYVNFFLESIYPVIDSIYDKLGVTREHHYVTKTLVMFGISFYTFEAISYTVPGRLCVRAISSDKYIARSVGVGCGPSTACSSSPWGYSRSWRSPIAWQSTAIGSGTRPSASPSAL
jgi:D-alanyl-lipoteichoic acid acyltransferase DltB (MBOAT superfamily)